MTITFKEWLKLKEIGAGAGVPYVGQKAGEGSWQGSPRGVPEPLSSVGNVKMKKKSKK